MGLFSFASCVQPSLRPAEHFRIDQDAFSTEDRNDLAVFERFATELAKFTTEEIQFLLAKALQLSLPELVYVTQVIHDPAHRPASMSEARQRIEAANNVTFVDYAQRMALPLWTQEGVQGRADLEEFARRGSLAAILDRLRGNPRVHIAHNADDPLTAGQSILALKKALGDQVIVFPYGGHLGNLWYPDNKELVLRILGATRPLRFENGEHVTVPCGIAHFSRKAPFPPRDWVEWGYAMTHWAEMARGGHFAAMEKPELLAADVRTFFRPLR